MSDSRTRLFQTIEAYAKALREDHSPVQMYDFGASTTVMPISKDGSWLTTSVCYLVLPGDGKPEKEKLVKSEGINDMGGGWKFLSVEIPLGMSQEELLDALSKAKDKLLETV